MRLRLRERESAIRRREALQVGGQWWYASAKEKEGSRSGEDGH